DKPTQPDPPNPEVLRPEPHTRPMAPSLAMQSMPLILRTLRPSFPFSRIPRPGLQLPPTPILKPIRSFSVCLQCQFRPQPRLHNTADDKEKTKYPLGSEAETRSSVTGFPPELTPPTEKEKQSEAEDEKTERELVENLEADLERRKESAQYATPEAIADIENAVGGLKDKVKQREEAKASAGSNRTQTGRLPSFLEERRSRISKQFTEMMDNLQGNVFVAGQRLNDLTGYSSIEALKNEIHELENELRDARLQVKKAKEAYQAAINNRSTSQREVNELLQRKHAWSSSDLERFTLLYRNDHANEVAEPEAQEALSNAERQSEEKAAQLSKTILSRYHEEQVWSDKIRRMSTWGTWGLMGVNVLLFLIFQVAVEPWRRRRLVKGFEDKVVEALEKEKAITEAYMPSMVSKGSQSEPEPAPALDAPLTSESASQTTEVFPVNASSSLSSPPRLYISFTLLC
ncbi:hypothetical protein N7470_008882, partial [Penicillium chermesinum]